MGIVIRGWIEGREDNWEEGGGELDGREEGGRGGWVGGREGNERGGMKEDRGRLRPMYKVTSDLMT